MQIRFFRLLKTILNRDNGAISLPGNQTEGGNHFPSAAINRYPADPGNGLYAEAYFHEMLTIERKRTERSKTPFLMMLLNIEKILSDPHKEEAIRKIASALTSITREIDIKGWHRFDSMIGIIFTEILGMDVISVKEKIRASLRAALGAEQADQVALSAHFFPETKNPRGPGGSPDMNLYPDLTKRSASQRTPLHIKRGIDIIGSLAGLILFSPFFLFLPLLIKISSNGPVFFRQERVGLHGRKFSFLKFRSMTANNDPRIHQEYVKNLIHGNGGESHPVQAKVYKITNDTRITPFGRILRKTSLDELPQFINVLKGEMSLVGPRPPIPYELDNYALWHRRRVLEVKPGMTGLWQVKGRSSTSFDEMVRLDLRYAREWSLSLDAAILLLTPWAVFNGKGAY